MKTAIDNGKPMMGELVTPTTAHEVMITGYTEDNQMQYFDSETGNYNNRPIEQFHGVRIINSVKP